MIPTKAIRNACMELLAADTATLAAVAANKIFLYVNNATPSENSVLADFTPATFTGSGSKLVTAGVQPNGYVPATQDSRIDLSPPAGGFRWECTATPTPAETCYGYCLTDNGGVTLLAAQRFTTPIVIASIGDAIALSDPNLTLLANSIS
jgi:hypothetical protein